jgi:hypothetical protein
MDRRQRDPLRASERTHHALLEPASSGYLDHGLVAVRGSPMAASFGVIAIDGDQGDRWAAE